MSIMKCFMVCVLPITIIATTAMAQTPTSSSAPTPSSTQSPRPNATSGLEVKWVRDSAEYWALATQTYRTAGVAVEIRAKRLNPSQVWCVVVDVDETVLDNSVYELERLAYGVSNHSAAWNEWVEKRQAIAVPGAVSFLQMVHNAKGRVVFISNRDAAAFQATQDNLKMVGMWGDNDLLCLASNDRTYDKKARRSEILKGEGACSWPGAQVVVLAYVGDQLGDLPESGEAGAGDRQEYVGDRYFLLPNPMYGGWVSKVTRPR